VSDARVQAGREEAEGIMKRRVDSVSRRALLQAGAAAVVGAGVAHGTGVSTYQQGGGRGESRPSAVKALVFDTFGTVVDWRTSVAREVETLAKRKGVMVDGAKFADAWRAGYGPSMNRVRTGELPWTKLDVLHRMILETMVGNFGLDKLSESEKDSLNRAWHRLTPWPDAVSGLTRLKKKFIIAPLSNGNVSLMTDLAKHGGLPWDLILGAELARHYKPDREVYQSAADFLDLKTSEVMMVAAHLADLHAAKGVGLPTAFVARPLEYGPNGKPDLVADPAIDISARDFNDLAAQLGA
jgi:2-haloacid dehalogenase